MSLPLLALTSPIQVGVAFVVRCKLGKPVIFRQQRSGLHGRTIDILKFRTMSLQVDSAGKPRPDDERITAIGMFLRSSSLDELPNLLSVVKGDLSLVGPRPLLTDYLSAYSEMQFRRHEVLPGVTGWAQIHGRNTISWEQRFEFDVWYVDHLSLKLDLIVLWRTVIQAIGRRGVTAEGSVTMPPFTG